MIDGEESSQQQQSSSSTALGGGQNPSAADAEGISSFDVEAQPAAESSNIINLEEASNEQST